MPDINSDLSGRINYVVWSVLINCKRATHLQCDLTEMHVMLLLKILDHDDVTALTSRVRSQLSLLEDDLNLVLGKPELGLSSKRDAFISFQYDSRARRMALATTSVCETQFKAAHSTIKSVNLFFEQFENLKMLSNKQAEEFILKISAIMPVLRDLFSRPLDSTATGLKLPSHLVEIDRLKTDLVAYNYRLNQHCNLLEFTLSYYTRGIIGHNLLQQVISPFENCIVKRRAICQAAAKAIGTIPLTTSPTPGARHGFSGTLGLYLGFMVFALVALVVAFAYRLLCVVFAR